MMVSSIGGYRDDPDTRASLAWPIVVACPALVRRDKADGGHSSQ